MGCGHSKGETKISKPTTKEQKGAQQKLIEEIQRQLQGEGLKEEEIIAPGKGFDENIIDRGVETV